MNMDAKKIGDALDAAMQAYDGGRGIKQASLSRISGVPQPTISRTLGGKSIPETETLTKLVSVLGSETLGKTVAAIIHKPVAQQATMAALVAKIFALPCKGCGHVSHQSFADLEANATIPCPTCGNSIDVTSYYGKAKLAEFLKSIGAIGIAVRDRN